MAVTRRGARRRKRRRHLSAGTVKWVGEVGFNEAYRTLTNNGTDPELARSIAGKGKALAFRRGLLAPEHAYGRRSRK